MSSEQLLARLFHDISNPCDHNVCHMSVDMVEADTVLKETQLREHSKATAYFRVQVRFPDVAGGGKAE